MSEWQPIATAPRDGTKVLLFDPISHYPSFVGYSMGEYWLTVPSLHYKIPTHWMPLPAPPAAME